MIECEGKMAVSAVSPRSIWPPGKHQFPLKGSMFLLVRRTVRRSLPEGLMTAATVAFTIVSIVSSLVRGFGVRLSFPVRGNEPGTRRRRILFILADS